MEAEKIMKKMYYELKNPVSFGSPGELYKSVKKMIPGVKMSQIKKFLAKQSVYTLNKNVKTKFKSRKTVVRGLDHQWQADLISFQSLANYNSGHNYILSVIDILSRFAWIEPLKRKTGADVVRAFKKIFQESKRRCLKLQTDLGTEFHNKVFKKFLNGEKVIHFSSYSDHKCALVERFNRTIQAKIYKAMAVKETSSYLKFLPDIIESYNSKVHSAHGFAPKSVNKRNQRIVWNILYFDYLKTPVKQSRFKVGDRVRLAKKKEVFTRSYHAQWTDEIFIIKAIKKTIPITFEIKDQHNEKLEGSFYENEIVKVLT